MTEPAQHAELARVGWSPVLQQELASLLNRWSQERQSNTPDFVLAEYMLNCLAAWNKAMRDREKWYGRDGSPDGSPDLERMA